MTTVGVSFRAWFAEKDGEALELLHGDAVKGDHKQYIDADSEHGWVLSDTARLVKNQIPPRAAPVLPSQPLGEYRLAEHGPTDSRGEEATANLPMPLEVEQLGGDYAQGGARRRQQHITRSTQLGSLAVPCAV